MDEGLYTIAEAAAAWGISKQALHMASLQKRLPAPGKGFFEGVKNFFSKKGEQ